MYLNNDFLSCEFNDSGALISVSRKGLTIPMAGLGFDAGCNEQMVNGLLDYDSMLEFRTWNLPDIRPTGKRFTLAPDAVYSRGENSLTMVYTVGEQEYSLCYTLENNYLKADLRIENTGAKVQYLNTAAFILSLPFTGGVCFDFPGNAPIWHVEPETMQDLKPEQTGLINFAVHTRVPGGDLNLLFIDETEKWGCGVYRNGNTTEFCFDAGMEADLPAGNSLKVGTFYVMPCADGDGDPYLQIREMVAGLGFKPCEDGIHDGVMYSGHPSGTMDAKFPFKDDLYQYAEYLPAMRKMGIDHVWLLPVFDHNERGVYHSNDQAIIHERYGGEDGCKYYCDKAHELGMTILFDYVPHGPAPEFPVAKNNPEWPSKRRDGSLQDEWECVSMDYNHPGYQEYTTELVHDHVDRFGINGARIDCAMGGLSNWRPYPGNRPSGDSVLAGVHITEAIREGFIRGGVKPLNMPENFNLIPPYYHCTDLFYGMNLYRAFVELEKLLPVDPAAFVRHLTDFLEREQKITPTGLHKMRFLGNHDTVSWVWQSARAVNIYGTEPAKALFALISLIDGVPMIYQGDEDPSFACLTGENLTGYFTALFADRKRCLPRGSHTEYLHTGSPVFAFRRILEDVPADEYSCKGETDVLVLINLGREPAEMPAEAAGMTVIAGCGSADEKLSPFTYRILR